ncbi:3-oxoacyl-[acyl-carrier protein] reductase [Nocardioides marinisabuli]|uniref:3-oxoacyl-[acyl-carrier protein] reductase n=1 Tax=Nocardioides marinisabuli TaxID=419476 RepID=A0A7Y9F043_9ACTN|nr:SDR family NAD(P)-dependent oxidoreductase [Nocardioides marinisabuli]NYD57180.1 3-oxoacyl-[acyl-carrier protein] reductase [Nocardioides marinisabuli]
MTGPALDGHIAVVTGGVGGIGAAISEALARDGATVVAADVAPDTLERGAAMFSHLLDQPGVGEVRPTVLDVTDAEAVEALAAELGTIQVLVNNAGVGGTTAPVWETGIDRWHRDLDIMLTGPFLMCRAFLPSMLAAGYGRVVNLSSMAGKEGNANTVSYSSAKAGLIGLTKVVGKEVAGTGVLVNAVAPGVVESPMNKAVPAEFHEAVLAKIPMGRSGTRAELAELVRFLASPRLGFSTGAVFDFSGGRATY